MDSETKSPDLIPSDDTENDKHFSRLNNNNNSSSNNNNISKSDNNLNNQHQGRRKGRKDHDNLSMNTSAGGVKSDDGGEGISAAVAKVLKGYDWNLVPVATK